MKKLDYFRRDPRVRPLNRGRAAQLALANFSLAICLGFGALVILLIVDTGIRRNDLTLQELVISLVAVLAFVSGSMGAGLSCRESLSTRWNLIKLLSLLVGVLIFTGFLGLAFLEDAPQIVLEFAFGLWLILTGPLVALLAIGLMNLQVFSVMGWIKN